VVAVVLTPALMPGLPVLVAALVAVAIGLFNWLGTPDGPAPVPGAAPSMSDATLPVPEDVLPVPGAALPASGTREGTAS